MVLYLPSFQLTYVTEKGRIKCRWDTYNQPLEGLIECRRSSSKWHVTMLFKGNKLGAQLRVSCQCVYVWSIYLHHLVTSPSVDISPAAVVLMSFLLAVTSAVNTFNPGGCLKYYPQRQIFLHTLRPELLNHADNRRNVPSK